MLALYEIVSIKRVSVGVNTAVARQKIRRQDIGPISRGDDHDVVRKPEDWIPGSDSVSGELAGAENSEPEDDE